MKLPVYAIHNYQFTLIIVALLTLLGVLSYQTMPRSEDPQFEFPMVIVSVIYPGTSPLDMEKLVTDPVEEEINELEDIRARVEITPVSGDLQYYIPIESVFKADNGMARVFVLDEDTRKVNEVSVEIIEFLNDEVAVRGSLKASDKVIKLGAPYLTDGSAVSVIEDS